MFNPLLYWKVILILVEFTVMYNIHMYDVGKAWKVVFLSTYQVTRWNIKKRFLLEIDPMAFLDGIN